MAMSNLDEERLKTKKETARFLGISEPGLDRLRAAGLIQYIRVGSLVRFTQADIQEYIDSRRVSRKTGGGAAA
jgi:excisionase family DNA binding protein